MVGKTYLLYLHSVAWGLNTQQHSFQTEYSKHQSWRQAFPGMWRVWGVLPIGWPCHVCSGWSEFTFPNNYWGWVYLPFIHFFNQVFKILAIWKDLITFYCLVRALYTFWIQITFQMYILQIVSLSLGLFVWCCCLKVFSNIRSF
jgi:hypothetical protein